MWNSPHTLRRLVKHEDARGLLVELLRFDDPHIPEGGQVYTFTILPGQRRGDHYHHHKCEWFTCVHGHARVLLTTPDDKLVSLDLALDSPSLLYVGAGTTHALINEGNELAVIVSYGIPAHNPDAPDTYVKEAYPGYQRV